MKKMRKRRIAVLLAAVLLVLAVPMESFAGNPNAMQKLLNQGRVDWVDYTRIQTGSGSNMPVTVTACGFTFYGKVTNGGREIDSEEVDAIIRQVMMNMGMTRETIALMEYRLWADANSDDPINWDSTIAIAKKFIAGLTPAGMANAQTAMAAAIGVETLSEAGYEAIMNNGGTAVAVGMALEGVPGWIAGALASSGDEALNVISQKIRHSQLHQRAAEAAVKLNNFYENVNLEIRRREFESSEDGVGHFVLHGVKPLKATVFNVPIQQILTVDIDAWQIDGFDDMSLDGQYKGSIDIKISNDLTNLDSNFKSAVILAKGSPYLDVPQGGSHTIVDSKMGQMILEKTLSADVITFTVPPVGGSKYVTAIDDRFLELDNYNILRKVVITSDIGVARDDNTGNYALGSAKGTGGTTSYVYHTMREVNGRRYPALKVYSSRILVEGGNTMVGSYHKAADITTGSSGPFIQDDQVYKILQNSVISIEGGKVITNVAK